jgi:hypothetical protein
VVRQLLIGLAAFAALSACQVRNPDPCAVRCTSATGCPDEMTCGADGFCYGADQAVGSCTGAVPDGGSDGTCDSPCEAVSQCGCDGEEGCYLSGSGEAACLASGDRTQDMTCAGDDDCAAGYDCVSAGPGGRHCQKYCGADADCDGDLSLCNREVGGGAARICTSDCDPMVGGCRSGEDCVLGVGMDGRFDANCRVPGSSGYGAACVDQADCAAGLLCVTSAGAGTLCEYLCEVGTADCGSSVACGRLDPPALFGGTEFGVCNF